MFFPEKNKLLKNAARKQFFGLGSLISICFRQLARWVPLDNKLYLGHNTWCKKRAVNYSRSERPVRNF